MTDWQERITRGTAPAIRIEHDVRYAAAAPLILDAPLWADLGCGNGVAPASVLAGRFHGRAILADVEEAAVRTAAAEHSGADVIPLVADLSAAEDLERVRAALLDGPAPRTITCFETVEHLRTFVPLVELLGELAREADATVALSVPNDAHWSIENPYHVGTWGEASLEELRSVLPADHVVARQVPLTGSAIVVGDEAAAQSVDVEVSPERVASHLLVAFGPRAEAFAATAGAGAVDLDDQRRWERRREADIAFYEVAMRAAQEQADEHRRVAEEHIARVDEFRTYIHELEDRLGIPRAGTPEAPPPA
jgi:hypothetical protein